MIDLVGHILNKVTFSETEATVSLTVDGDKVFVLKVDADCCSAGKFISISNEWNLDLPQKIMQTKDRTESFDVDQSYQVYETTFLLENGRELKVVYDNMSNGYYGSSLDAYYENQQIYEFPEVKK